LRRKSQFDEPDTLSGISLPNDESCDEADNYLENKTGAKNPTAVDADEEKKSVADFDRRLESIIDRLRQAELKLRGVLQ